MLDNPSIVIIRQSIQYRRILALCIMIKSKLNVRINRKTWTEGRGCCTSHLTQIHVDVEAVVPHTSHKYTLMWRVQLNNAAYVLYEIIPHIAEVLLIR